jgi:hypothetical protein
LKTIAPKKGIPFKKRNTIEENTNIEIHNTIEKNTNIRTNMNTKKNIAIKKDNNIKDMEIPIINYHKHENQRENNR